MSKALGEKLRALREHAGLKQRHLSGIFSVDRSTYAYYETGKTEPCVDILLAIARFYSVPFEWLCDRERGVYEYRGHPDERFLPTPETLRNGKKPQKSAPRTNPGTQKKDGQNGSGTNRRTG